MTNPKSNEENSNHAKIGLAGSKNHVTFQENPTDNKALNNAVNCMEDSHEKLRQNITDLKEGNQIECDCQENQGK